MLVLDASVTLAWCFEDEAVDLADRVLDRLGAVEAMTPAIWPCEVANGIRTAERRGRLDPAEIPRLRELLRALPIRVMPLNIEAALAETLDLARRLDLSAYDAAYLGLALERALPLATIDARLAQAARRSGVELVA
ncbi:MAG: type II toxin-antitoxin system VapC family toxin [Chloroflexi bacterium]|nr:type II toxin-antitoxin system VapC family toxin [Chloroflexota bacterium]